MRINGAAYDGEHIVGADVGVVDGGHDVELDPQNAVGQIYSLVGDRLCGGDGDGEPALMAIDLRRRLFDRVRHELLIEGVADGLQNIGVLGGATGIVSALAVVPCDGGTAVDPFARPPDRSLDVGGVLLPSIDADRARVDQEPVRVERRHSL